MSVGNQLTVNEYFPSISKRLIEVTLESLCENKSHFYQSHKINKRWENQYLDLEYIPEIKEIFQFACLAGKNITGDSLLVPFIELGLPVNEFWFNISKPDESTGLHNHNEKAILSGVFYLKVRKKSGDINFKI